MRMSLLYAAFLAVIGIQQPFWPVWLAAKGLTSAEIGLMLALSIGIKMVSAPAVAHLADRSGERKWLMVISAAIAVAAFASFIATEGFWPILAISILYYAAWPPIVTLAESVTMKAARLGQFDYGRVRLWGSLSYIAAAAGAGQVLAMGAGTADGGDAPTVSGTIYAMLLALQLAVFAVCCFAPDEREAASTGARLPLLAVLANRPFFWFLIASGLIQASHGVYYAFATLAWKAAGFSEAVIGLLWAEGVVAEIVLFAFGARLIRRLGPRRLLAIAGGVAAVRWIGTGLTDALPALALLQLLHAFSFGASHLAAMHSIVDEVPAELSATAQSLYSGLVWGLFLGLGLVAAGGLFEVLAVQAFLPMAVPALAGGAVAWWLASRQARWSLQARA